MSISRRSVIKAGGGAALYSALASMGFFAANPAAAAAWKKDWFETKNIPDTLKAMGIGATANSGDITITSPDIAENGAVVPVGATSKLPNTTEIFLIVEKNPMPLSCGFTIPAGTVAEVQTRLKMGQSTNVIAVVKADGKLYSATKETKVTLGGCGG